MLDTKLREALKKGESNFNLREKNVLEIEELIKKVDSVIKDATSNNVELVSLTRVATFADLVVANLASEKTAEEKSGQINRKILRIQSIKNPKVYTNLTSLDLSENGFPCTMVISGNDRIARDIDTLEEYFFDLLSTYRTIEAIKKAELADEEKQN